MPRDVVAVAAVVVVGGGGSGDGCSYCSSCCCCSCCFQSWVVISTAYDVFIVVPIVCVFVAAVDVVVVAAVIDVIVNVHQNSDSQPFELQVPVKDKFLSYCPGNKNS